MGRRKGSRNRVIVQSLTLEERLRLLANLIVDRIESDRLAAKKSGGGNA